MRKRIITAAALVGAGLVGLVLAAPVSRAESGAASRGAAAAKPGRPIIIQLPKCYRKVCNPVLVCDGVYCRIDWECVTIEVECPVNPA